MADFALMQETMAAVRLGTSTVPRSFSPAPYNQLLNRTPEKAGSGLFTKIVQIDLTK